MIIDKFEFEFKIKIRKSSYFNATANFSTKEIFVHETSIYLGILVIQNKIFWNFIYNMILLYIKNILFRYLLI